MDVSSEHERQRQHELTMDRRKAYREAAAEYARQSLEYSLNHGRAMKEYGQQALRALFLMNGGGILATLTFVGAFAQSDNQFSPAQFVWPLGAFVAGLASCVLSMFAAYLNFQAHSIPRSNVASLCNSIIELKESYEFQLDDAVGRRMDRTNFWGNACGFLSGGCFLLACGLIGAVFRGVS